MNYKNSYQFLTLICVMLLVSSCATILGGKKNTISVKQNGSINELVENVGVYLDGEFIGNTPLKIRISKYKIQEGSIIEIKSVGFETIEYEIVRRPHVGYVLLNVVTGALPLIVDVLNGNIYRPNTRQIEYDLVPLNSEDLIINDTPILKN